MEQKEYFGAGNIKYLEEMLVDTGARNIFLVTGKASYESSGAKEKIDSLLKGLQVTPFSNFSKNPNLQDVEKGIAQFNQGKYDLVIAIGGGSVIDMAKLINTLAAQSHEPHEYICKGAKALDKRTPLVAIPTTSGSGSEATHFAVVYVAGTKYSVSAEDILPDYSIVDPELTYNLPPKITAESGIDALAQAIESYWCINSTEGSKHYSREAIRLVMDNLVDAVNNPTPRSRRGMALASNFAGKAINITKTTAPHSVSYPMVSNYDLAHGHAVGLTLPSILLYNSEVSDDDVLDKRGVDYVHNTMREINLLLGAKNATDAKEKLTYLMESIGLPTKLSRLDTTFLVNIELIVEQGFNPDRVKNNPRQLTQEALKKILLDIF